MDRTPLVVFRIGKLKSWGEIGAAASHNLRTRPTPNAGAGGFIDVVPLEGRAVDAVRAKIGDQTIRKNAVLAVEAIVSASPEYFRPDAPDRAGHWDQDRLDAWRAAVEPWIKEKFPHAVSVVLHLDEATPHYQILDVPLDAKGKLNCRDKYGGPAALKDWQTSAALAVEKLGIQRGIPGSEATHQRVKAFYGAVNSPTPEIPAVTTPVPKPLPPRTAMEKLPLTDAKQERDALEENREKQRQQRELEKQRQQKAINQAWPDVSKKANAVDLAKKKAMEAEATAAKYAQAKKAADQLRALSLDQVLKQVYGAQLEKDSKAHHSARKYILADGRKVAVSKKGDAEVWIEQAAEGGKGAINLVMYLDRLDYKAALRLLSDHFDPGAMAKEHAREMVERAKTDIAIIRQEPVAMPPADPSKWPKVKRWLHEVRGLPKKLIDRLHALGFVYADFRANAVFKRDKGGAFLRGTGDKKFHRSIGGPECGPFIIPNEKHNKVVLVEAPLDAIAVVAMDPKALAIASGGDQLPPAALTDWVPIGMPVFAGHDNDKRGDQVAEKAAEAFGAKRLSPPVGDWSETVKIEPWRINGVWEDVDTSSPQKKPPRPDLTPS